MNESQLGYEFNCLGLEPSWAGDGCELEKEINLCSAPYGLACDLQHRYM
ncbi:protein of unassigned function [Methylobacterium oryzae CBMB20]|uniref:Protein of unassigned function n=1 Tax=Methylobacterium oryzae CBMB20 TaxID=693986 RepID=A0A089NQ87_9HYPH|nr:protein of unassigned function [Methylobacterium oryzae CBMB20]